MAEERIVFLDRDTIAPQITLRRPAFSHQWAEYPRTAPEQVIERAKGASILIVNKVKITGDVIAALPSLKLIAVSATGTDNIDKAAAADRGIAVRNIVNYATTTVPEHVFAMILALKRQLFGYREAVIAGRWQEVDQFCFFDYPVQDLRGKVLGIVGRGSIGGAVGAIGQAFGMAVIYAGRKGAAGPTGAQNEGGSPTVPFAEFLARADVISLHCPLTPDTRNLISTPEFEAMVKRPVLINTGRGGLVDEGALTDALDRGLISAAGFDVVTSEPPPADHPLMQLARRPNVLLTPHTAWASDEAMQGLADQLIDNIEAFVAGSETG